MSWFHERCDFLSFLDTQESCDSEPPPTVPECPGAVETQKRFFTGVVTAVASDCGMINEHIHFEMGVVMGGVNVVVGDLVHCEAERKHSKGGWRAAR